MSAFGRKRTLVEMDHLEDLMRISLSAFNGGECSSTVLWGVLRS
ncbi:MAG: hypothetical protein ACI8VC_002385 [Candidatus Endobugula sp.]|jgi:hypothetical protein